MEFIAINLDDFHKNQHRDAKTVAEMVFVEADSLLTAKKYMELNFPETPWAVVSKNVFDRNIVTRQVYKAN